MERRTGAKRKPPGFDTAPAVIAVAPGRDHAPGRDPKNTQKAKTIHGYGWVGRCPGRRESASSLFLPPPSPATPPVILL